MITQSAAFRYRIGMFKKSRIQYYLLALTIFLGSLLRFYHIGQQPLWLDEAFSYWFSGLTIDELWTVVPQFETNPPLYYTILKIWSLLFGSTEACLRSLSAVMSIGCIPLVFLIGKRIGKPDDTSWLGVIAAFLFSVFPVHVQYAQEARSYAMLTFAASLVLLMVLWIMTDPKWGCEPIIGRSGDQNNGKGLSKFLPWLTTVFAVSFTLWLHNTAVLYIVTIFSIVLVWFFRELNANRTFLSNLLIVVILVCLSWVPYLIFLIPQTTSASLPIPKPTALSVIDAVAWLLLGSSLTSATVAKLILKIAVLVFIFTLAAVGWFHIRRRYGRYVSILILGSIFGPILAELVFSVLYRPIFLARTLVYVSVPFYIAVAAGILSLRDSRKRALVTIMVALILLKWTYSFHAMKQEREPWDQIAQTVAQKAREDIVLLVPNNIELPFSYYANSIRNNNLQIIPLPFSMSCLLRQAASQRLGPDIVKAIQIGPSHIPAISKAIAGKSRVWLITRREDIFDQDRIVFSVLKKEREFISASEFGDINVFQFN